MGQFQGIELLGHKTHVQPCVSLINSVPKCKMLEVVYTSIPPACESAGYYLSSAELDGYGIYFVLLGFFGLFGFFSLLILAIQMGMEPMWWHIPVIPKLTSNSSVWGAEAGGWHVQGQPMLHRETMS
jgi:uncharacterized protein (DUF983 family)